TRNRGTELARGEFIAVMDSDDISLPDRLEKQVAYLDSHPSVGVVGGAFRSLQGKEEILSTVRSFPLTPGLCAWFMHFSPSACHGASMLRRSLLVEVGGYRPEYMVAVDYDLWERLSHYTWFANIADVVLFYRRHDSSISIRRS